MLIGTATHPYQKSMTEKLTFYILLAMRVMIASTHEAMMTKRQPMRKTNFDDKPSCSSDPGTWLSFSSDLVDRVTRSTPTKLRKRATISILARVSIRNIQPSSEAQNGAVFNRVD